MPNTDPIQKQQETVLHDYLTEKPKDIFIDNEIQENEQALGKLNQETEIEKCTSKISYLDAVKGAYKKGQKEQS